MTNQKSLFLGLIVGGVIGSVSALLSTPSSGREFRDQIKGNREKLEEIIVRLKNDSIALKEQLVKTAKESSEVVKEVSTDLQQSVKEWREEIAPHQQNLQKEIAEIEEKMKQLEQTLQK
ncbi:YtxH domain-containing protein [Metabacillus arenae]|uniref:YtxH domain-containing protein n=1 Tax=Metabacillus arenae TaxID=2771434 RepID=A0A926NFQ4_9BACI|nr:YtxH domain-containing protein [Metabacillus arenae]MBD1380709.1 YtxH domain-containing protein [Metabacillus arenae]